MQFDCMELCGNSYQVAGAASGGRCWGWTYHPDCLLRICAPVEERQTAHTIILRAHMRRRGKWQAVLGEGEFFEPATAADWDALQGFHSPAGQPLRCAFKPSE